MSFWKTLAKIAIPVGAAVAAPFTGGGSLGLLGLGAGAGAATGALDGGWKGALKGAAIGGAGSALAGPALRKIFGSGTPIAMNAGSNAAVSAGGRSIADIMANPSLANIANGTLATSPGVVNGINSTGASSGGWLSKLGGLFGNNNASGEGSASQNLADLGSTLGAFGQGEATNRYMKGAMSQKYDSLVNDMTKTNQASESDALKKLAQTKYLLNGGAAPVNYQGASGTLTNFGFGPTPASDAQKAGAQTLQDQLLKRLTPEGAIKPTDPSTYLDRGIGENIGRYGALGASGLGTVLSMFGKNQGQDQVQ